MKIKDLLPPTWVNWILLCLCFAILSYYFGTVHTTRKIEKVTIAEPAVASSTGVVIPNCIVVPVKTVPVAPAKKTEQPKAAPKEEHIRKESQPGWLSRAWNSIF